MECGLGPKEKVPSETAHMVWDKKGAPLKKEPQYCLPLSNRCQDVRVQHNRTSVRKPFLLGFILVAFTFTALRIIPVNHTWFKDRVRAWSKICGSDHGWKDTPVLDIKSMPQDLADHPRMKQEIPQYVFDYAPLVHLYSEEQFWPCDIKEHLFHVTPELNYTPIKGLPQLNLTNLDLLNQFAKGRYVFLTSNDNVEDRPDWLGGQINIPDDYTDDAASDHAEFQSTMGKHPKQSHGGHSDAPAVLLTVDKGDGIMDAFWFFFYSYNLGNIVFNIRFGNHIGDWEHTLIRFEHGKPQVVFVSEHFFGSAYSYSAIEKIGNRVSMKCSLSGLAR